MKKRPVYLSAGMAAAVFLLVGGLVLLAGCKPAPEPDPDLCPVCGKNPCVPDANGEYSFTLVQTAGGTIKATVENKEVDRAETDAWVTITVTLDAAAGNYDFIGVVITGAEVTPIGSGGITGSTRRFQMPAAHINVI